MNIQDSVSPPQVVGENAASKKRPTFAKANRLAQEKNCTSRKHIGGKSTVYGYFLDLPDGGVLSFGRLTQVVEFLERR